MYFACCPSYFFIHIISIKTLLSIADKKSCLTFHHKCSDRQHLWYSFRRCLKVYWAKQNYSI